MKLTRDDCGRDAALRALRARIAFLKSDLWKGSAETRSSALDALKEALALGNPVLEAESIALLGRNYGLMLRPAEAFSALARAHEIFAANNRHSDAAHCQVIAARALFDMGHDQSAIAFVKSVLRHGSLAHEHRVAAFCIRAMAYAHMGAIDKAVHTINERALPLLETTEQHPLRAQAFTAAAAVYLQLILSTKKVYLWRSTPVFRRVVTYVPDVDKAREFVRHAKEAMPEHVFFPILVCVDLLLDGLVDSKSGVAHTLKNFAEKLTDTDPAGSCWAHFCAALVHRQELDFASAGTQLRQSLRLAANWGLNRATYDGLLQIARVHEDRGDTGRSLRAYKAYLSVTERIAHHRYEPWLPSKEHHDTRPWSHTPETPLKNIEPQIVRQAVAYIQEHLSTRILIVDICSACGVGRRTLEVAFRNAKEMSIAQFIKECRLDEAAQALQHTNASVKRISESVGYKSAAAFGRDFLIRFGIQPAKWRRQRGVI